MGWTRWFREPGGDARVEKEDGKKGGGSKLAGVVSLRWY
jgi:hypothetical protein